MEAKRERFKRLAIKRTNAVLDKLRLVGQLSNKANYEYEEEDVRKIFRAIDEQLQTMKAKFKGTQRKEFKL